MATKIIGLGEIMGALAQGAAAVMEPKVGTREEALKLIDDRHTFAVGDIVKWRCPEVANRQRPAADEQVIVTDVFSPAHRWGEDGSERTDVYVVFAHHCGEPSCSREGELVEYGLDSRRLVKVGSILN